MGARAAPLRYALVGCGRIAAAVHLPALTSLHKQGVVELVGVCDWTLERAKRAATPLNVPAFERWEEMIGRTQASAMSVCLPPGANAAVAAAAIEAGVHVLCEKPPGRDLADAERMAAAAAAHPDRIGMIGFNRRHAALYRAAMARSLALGPPHAFSGRFTRASLGAPPSDTAVDWITSDGSHALDLAVATLGFPRAAGVARRRVGTGPDNSWTIHLHCDNGSALLWLDFAAGRRVERFEWTGPGYDALLELPDTAEWSQQGSAVERWPASAITQSEEVWVNYGFLHEYEAFLDAIRGDAPRPATDFAYAVDFMRLVQTILECPSGETRTIPERSHRIEPPDHAESIAPVKRVRPVVRLMQNPAVHERFFAMEDFSRLSRRCDVHADASTQNSMDGVEAIVTGWSSTFPTLAQLDTARSLNLVVVMGASVRGIHAELLLSRGVTICNTADAIAASVAEHCVLLTLAGLRLLTDVDRQMHGGDWPPHGSRVSGRALIARARRSPVAAPLIDTLRPLRSKLRGRFGLTAGTRHWHDLRGQTVGLVGWGHVARHVVRLLEPFDCQILVASGALTEPQVSQYRVKVASLSEVLAASTVVSVHKGLTESSRGLIGRSELDLLRSGSVLINTARSALIDEAALIERARRGDIVVGLDVFDVEPLPRRHPLRRLRNVILTPHSASSTPECQRRIGGQALALLDAWVNGEPLPAITAAQLARMTL
jgi:phosphoglycerate dehydrogenase-like enzyme/predicted dehydrogenase